MRFSPQCPILEHSTISYRSSQDCDGYKNQTLSPCAVTIAPRLYAWIIEHVIPSFWSVHLWLRCVNLSNTKRMKREERRGEERRGTKGRTGRYVTRHNKRYLSCLFFQRFVALSKRQWNKPFNETKLINKLNCYFWNITWESYYFLNLFYKLFWPNISK